MPKTFCKDKAVLKKEVMRSKGTQYVQKAFKDANVQCNVDSSPSKDASITDETLDDIRNMCYSVIVLYQKMFYTAATELVAIAKVMKMVNQERRQLNHTIADM